MVITQAESRSCHLLTTHDNAMLAQLVLRAHEPALQRLDKPSDAVCKYPFIIIEGNYRIW